MLGIVMTTMMGFTKTTPSVTANTNVGDSSSLLYRTISLASHSAGQLLLVVGHSGTRTMSIGANSVGTWSQEAYYVSSYLKCYIYKCIASNSSMALELVQSTSGGVYYFTKAISDADTIASANVAIATPGTPDPPNLDLGATKNAVWVASAANAYGYTPSNAPSNYSNLQNTSYLCNAERTLEDTQSENPGQFGGTVTLYGIQCMTIAAYKA